MRNRLGRVILEVCLLLRLRYPFSCSPSVADTVDVTDCSDSAFLAARIFCAASYRIFAFRYSIAVLNIARTGAVVGALLTITSKFAAKISSESGSAAPGFAPGKFQIGTLLRPGSPLISPRKPAR